MLGRLLSAGECLHMAPQQWLVTMNTVSLKIVMVSNDEHRLAQNRLDGITDAPQLGLSLNCGLEALSEQE